MTKISFKIADYIIIGFILFLGLAGVWLNLQGVSAAERRYAHVYVENELVAELSVSSGESFSYSFNFGDHNQHTAVIEIEDGRIRMLPMSEDLCPRGICSHTGWISFTYESIVCLPNQIMIVFSETSPQKDEYDVDGVTF